MLPNMIQNPRVVVSPVLLARTLLGVERPDRAVLVLPLHVVHGVEAHLLRGTKGVPRKGVGASLNMRV